MKISNLKLKNIKCFEDVEISFKGENGNIKNWSLIAGDNGQGKTTILRSIAAGLCDSRGASALLSELGDFITQGKKEGEIEITLQDDQKKEHTVKTTINPEFIEQDKKFDKKKLFAVAYGARRSVTGIESYPGYILVDAVYSLFNYVHELQNAELSARRLDDEGQWDDAKNILKKVLMLEPQDEIELDKRGLYVKTSEWKKIYIEDISDGYAAMTSVILDFLSWKLLNVEKFDLENLSGIFIIDEIEQHLHPRWQRKIISILAEQFPNMQFICSTHAPICVLGLSDLECESQLVKVGYANGYSEAKLFDLRDDYKGYRYDQILSSDIFGALDARSVSIEDELKKYRELYRKDESERSDEDKTELKAIEDELKGLPMWDSVEDREMKKDLLKLLKSKNTNDKD